MFLIGCGTAYHAGLAGSYLLSRIAKMDVHVSPASEFAKVEQFVTPDSLIMALTQSGETIDVVEPLNRVKARGTKVLSLVNVQGSTIYRLSDYHLLLGAGIEKAVASTKAYIAKLSLLTLIAYSLADKLDEGERLLQESAKEIKRLLTKPSLDTIQRIAIKLLNQQSMYIIGRGMSYPTAIEGALKIKEVSYIHAEGLAGGELKHGTIALIEEGTACIVLAPQDDNYEAILSNAMEIKARGGYIIGISPTNSPVFDEWIEVQSTGITLITQVVPLQILAYYLAVGKNLDPDMPRNLAKSVTVR
jgi:glucosamine--fructose-6-phosphate aminotransferase (isomerizing)